MNTPNVIRTAPARKADPLAQRRRLAEQHANANREAARIILDDPEKYGRGSLMHRWASAVLYGPEAATREWWRRTA